MSTIGPGRPRKQQQSRPGATARDEILDAAAELFTTQGFANTSTRSIADAVGIRQSSLYHHFGHKDDILEVLLAGTVAGSLAFARRMLSGLENEAPGAGDSPGDRTTLRAAARLHALALFDSTQLCTARWNLGVLYNLPEARSERFSRFMADRQELRGIYGRLGDALTQNLWEGAGHGGDLVFRVVESLVNLRADGLLAPDSALQAANAGLVLCGLGGILTDIQAASSGLLADAA